MCNWGLNSETDGLQPFWNSSHRNGEESLIGALNQSCRKYPSSQSTSLVPCYPLHATLSNLMDERRRNHTRGWRTIVAYLPVKFQCRSRDNQERQFLMIEGYQSTQRKLDCINFQPFIHEPQSVSSHLLTWLRKEDLQQHLTTTRCICLFS